MPPNMQRDYLQSRNILAKNKSGILLDSFLKLTVAVYLLIFVRYQADPHHDGYILGSAAAVAEGFDVHSGAFSQYGPVTPWLVGFFLNLSSVSVLNMRFLAGILIFLTYIILERIIRLQGASPSISRLIPLAWILANHVTSTKFDGAFFLWPSVISTFFLLASMYLLLLSGNTSNSRKAEIGAFISGILITLAFFTRIQSVLVILALLILRGVLFKELRKITSILTGAFFGFIAIVLLLIRVQAFDDFWQQVIVWPASVYPQMGSGNNYNRFQFVIYASLSIASICYFLLTKSLFERIKGVIRWSVIPIIGGCIYFVAIINGELLASNNNTYLRLIVGDQFNRIIFWPHYLAFMIALLFPFFILFKWRKSPNVTNGNNLTVCAFGVSVTPQIFPQPDIAHLWWILPILLPSSLLFLQLKRINAQDFTLPLLSILIAASMSSINYLGRDWREYGYKPLVGTFASPQKVRTVDVYEPLTTFLSDKKAVFICADGIHSTAAGRYSSVDKWYVEWGPIVKDLELERINQAENVVVCDQKRVQVDSLAERYRLTTVLFQESLDGDIYRSVAVLTRGR